MLTKSISELAREQRKVVNKLLANWPSGETLQHSQSLEDKFVSGFIGFSLALFHPENFASGEDWKWRQCGPRVRVEIDHETTIVLQKLNPREKEGAVKPLDVQGFKIWNIRVRQPMLEFTCIYCEKGYHPKESREIDGDHDSEFLENLLRNTSFEEVLGEHRLPVNSYIP